MRDTSGIDGTYGIEVVDGKERPYIEKIDGTSVYFDEIIDEWFNRPDLVDRDVEVNIRGGDEGGMSLEVNIRPR